MCCGKLNNVTISDSVTSIGQLAFSYCDALEEVSIPGNVKELERKAFYAMASLRKVTLHEGLETIGEKAFGHCEQLTELIIPTTVNSIGHLAFQGYDLVKISVPPQLCDTEAIIDWGLDENCKIIVNEN